MFQDNLLVILLSLVISINLNQGVNQIYLHIKEHIILRYELLSDPIPAVKEFCYNKNTNQDQKPLSSFFKISCTQDISWKDSSGICNYIDTYIPSADRYWIITTKCGIKNISFLNIKSFILR